MNNQDFTDALGSVFDKITEVINLSFFPAGAACLAAVVFWDDKAHLFDVHISSGFAIAGAVLASYILGLVCFSGGRLLRNTLTRKGTARNQQRLAEYLDRVCKHHGLDFIYPTYFRGDHARPMRLYTRLWAELRQRPELRNSYALLRHYWVMSATYDGLSVALLVWAAVLVCWWRGFGVPLVPSEEGGHGAPVMAAIALGMSGLCLREAYRHFKNQVEELVGSVAAYYDCLPDRGPSPMLRPIDELHDAKRER